MSNWTHIAAITRIDALRGFGPEPDFTDIFGRELGFHDSEKQWRLAQEHPELFLPLGSEGSLKMSVWVNPDIYDITAYTISIWGDLRDHHDPDGIIQWFKDKLSTLDVREACIVVENELNGVRAWHRGMDEEAEESMSEV